MIKTRLDGMDKRFEDMNKRIEELRADMNSRFEEMRTDMNKRFEDHFNYNMGRFSSIELQINNILAEIRELRRILERKIDVDEFRRLENNYLELLKEITLLKQKIPA